MRAIVRERTKETATETHAKGRKRESERAREAEIERKKEHSKALLEMCRIYHMYIFVIYMYRSVYTERTSFSHPVHTERKRNGESEQQRQSEDAPHVYQTTRR